MANYRKRGCCGIVFLSPILAILGVVLFCNAWVTWSTRNRIFNSPDEIEDQSVALVLGTSKKVAPNTPNLHFENRIDAAAELFASGKISKILVSGYRDSRYYDEAKDMEQSLRDHGVPGSVILSDTKGNRTLDSIERTLSVHDIDKIVIISDGWHVHRALFIADRRGISAVAMASKPVPFRHSSPTRFREYLARVKAVIDLYLVSPKDSSRAAGWLKRMWKRVEVQDRAEKE